MRQAAILSVLTVSVMLAAIETSEVLAQTAIESAYSPIDLYTSKKSCRKLSKATEDEEFGQRWRCPGVGGVDVFVHYEDARDYLAYGRRGKQESNVFGLAPIGGVRETMEWRSRKDAKGKLQPFATISRMASSGSDSSCTFCPKCEGCTLAGDPVSMTPSAIERYASRSSLPVHGSGIGRQPA